MIKHLSVKLLSPRAEFDEEHVEDSRWIVTMARELLEPQHILQTVLQKEDIACNFDDSIVAALFLVAIRCRRSFTRWEAVRLLHEHPRREGPWDSKMAASIAQYLVETEEADLQEREELPLNSRLTVVRNEVFLSERRALVQCSKKGKGGADSKLLPVKIVIW